MGSDLQQEFLRDLKLDLAELDSAAVQQAELFFKWSTKAINARAEFEAAKSRLDLTEARLSLECRKNPEEFGLEKSTEAAVQQAVATHIEFLRARTAMYEAKTASAAADARVEAMEQKKRMIEVAVTLHGQNYFAKPSVARGLAQVSERASERAAAVSKAQKARSMRRGESNESPS